MAPSQSFLNTARTVFQRDWSSSVCHWITLKTNNYYGLHRFPPNTVFIRPAPGPPHMFPDDQGYTTITVPLALPNTYTSFALALDLLYSFSATNIVDMVAVEPFGPLTRATAQQMHDAFMFF